MNQSEGSTGLKRERRSEHRLLDSWEHALIGDLRAQSEWAPVNGGQWCWRADGVYAQGDGSEWVSMGCTEDLSASLRELGNFSLEVSVTGKAEAVGLSFGHYKDFLTPLDTDAGTRRLQLEVDAAAGCWAFHVDGRLMHRSWWDASVSGADDIIGGSLHLKGRGVEGVLFHDLSVHRYAASCRLTVIITCHRFLQRLRVCLRNWCHQSLPSGSFEILVVNPHSPDGTHEHMAAVAQSYPLLRVRELSVERTLATDKGAMINRAVSASRGEVIWLTDADCLFSPLAAAAVLDYIANKGQRVFYGQRRFLSAGQTAQLLSGQLDGLRDFDALARYDNGRAPNNVPWGYTQIAERSVMERLPYCEDLFHFASSDNIFIYSCQQRGIPVEQIPGLFCLHLEHPFAWYGTNRFM